MPGPDSSQPPPATLRARLPGPPRLRCSPAPANDRLSLTVSQAGFRGGSAEPGPAQLVKRRMAGGDWTPLAVAMILSV